MIRLVDYTHQKAPQRVEGHKRHDANDQDPIKPFRSDTQQGEADSQLDEANHPQIQRLSDKIEHQSGDENVRVNIATMATCTMLDLHDDNPDAGQATKHGKTHDCILRTLDKLGGSIVQNSHLSQSF